MPSGRRSLLVVALALGASSCGPGGTPQDANLAANKIAELTASVKRMESQLTTLQLQVASLQIDANAAEERESSASTAWFDPQAPKGYQAIEAPVGRVLFVLEKVEPYLDGYKVTFRVGNPTTATLSGFDAEITWGALPLAEKSGQPDRRSKSTNFTETIRPGEWANVTANLAPATVTEMRNISIKPRFSNIAMRRKRSDGVGE